MITGMLLASIGLAGCGKKSEDDITNKEIYQDDLEPLTEETKHIINEETIAKMKDGVILVNTSRGGLIKTEALISGIRDHKFFAVGLDVYEEETDFVFEDMSERILQSSITQRLLSFPNVVMTSHQGFFTKEALTNIAETTLENAKAFMDGNELKNEVLS